MALPIICKGSDEIIQITVTDGTNAIDLNEAEDITVSVYQTADVIIQQWLLSENEVTLVDAENGICSVALDRDNTNGLPTKRLYVQVDLKLVNAAFEDGYAIEKDIKPLCDLQNSVTND